MSEDNQSVEMQRAPFTADQIREAAFEGKQMLYHVEGVDEPAHMRLTTYVEVYDDHVVFEFEQLDTEGNPLEDLVEGEATWEDLESHATYPADKTEVSELSLDVVAGTFECWLYEVQQETDDGEPALIRAYFARERPGPPIRFEHFVNGELTYLMELLEGHGPAWEEE